LGINSCLYEIPKNDLVDDMKLWPPVTSPDVYCYLIETPGGFIWKKLKAYNFVISGWVKPLQVLKRNSGYDSHDATSPSSFPHPPSPEKKSYADHSLLCASFTAAVPSTIITKRSVLRPTLAKPWVPTTYSMAFATVNIDKIIKVTSASFYVFP